MLEDVRYALRQLRQNRGFAAIAIATLGLGIGAAAAMFGLIQGVLLSPPPYADPGRLVLVSTARLDGQPYERGSSMRQWLAWKGAKSVASPAAYRWTFNFLVLPDGSQSLGGMAVSPNFFRVLGVKPILGRELTAEDASRPKVPPSAVVIGYEMWQRTYRGDPNIIGQTLRLSRMPNPLPIVGVMPPGMRFLPDPGASSEPNYDVNAHVDFWAAMTLDETQPRSGVGNVVARLADGATLERANAEIATASLALARSDADFAGLTGRVSGVQDTLNEDGRRLLLPLFGAVLLVFVIACANVTGLLLSRGLQRQQEYAMRSALGAGRARLFRQTITESLVLALTGSLLGAAVAFAIVTMLKAIGGQAVPRADAVSVGWPVLVFGLVAALVASVVAGLLPALRASLPDRLASIKGSRASASPGERRLLSGVAMVQIVLTVALLAGAALLVRTARNLESVRPGYDTENILAMTVTAVQGNKYKEFHEQALARVAAVPGVRAAAFAWGVPLTGNKWNGEITIPGQPGSTAIADALNVPLRSITPGYFDVMGMQLLEGRPFGPADSGDAPPVAIINAAMARRYFAGVTAIGRQFDFAGRNPPRPVTIVGVLADTRTDTLTDRAEPEVYLPFWQSGAFSKHLVLRTTTDPLALAGLVRTELRRVDPSSAVEKVTTMAEIRRTSVATRTFALRLLAGFAVAATVLALVGLYGVLSLSVGSRTKEIAVRKAVGAQWHEVVRLVLREGSRLIAIGLVLGVAAALVLGRLLETLLFDVTAADPAALALAALVFGLVALLACLVPAMRAGRVDVMEALRQE